MVDATGGATGASETSTVASQQTELDNVAGYAGGDVDAWFDSIQAQLGQIGENAGALTEGSLFLGSLLASDELAEGTTFGDVTSVNADYLAWLEDNPDGSIDDFLAQYDGDKDVAKGVLYAQIEESDQYSEWATAKTEELKEANPDITEEELQEQVSAEKFLESGEFDQQTFNQDIENNTEVLVTMLVVGEDPNIDLGSSTDVDVIMNDIKTNGSSSSELGDVMQGNPLLGDEGKDATLGTVQNNALDAGADLQQNGISPELLAEINYLMTIMNTLTEMFLKVNQVVGSAFSKATQ